MFIIKKKLITVTISFIIIWLIISIYFYGQHYILIKQCPVYAKVDTGNVLVILKNIKAYNFEHRTKDFFGTSWYWSIAKEIDSPKIQQAFLKICSFYSRPYIFNKEERIIKLQGMIAFKDLKDINCDLLSKKTPVKIDIYGDYDVRLTNGMSLMNDNSNIIFFEAHGDEVILKDNHTYKVVIKDRKTEQLIKEIPFRPLWEINTYNFFQRKPHNYSYRPEYVINNFVKLLASNKKATAANYVHFKRSDVFPWDNLNHEYLESASPNVEFYKGSHLGYNDVFAIDLLYFAPDKRIWKPGEEFAKQTVYFIDYFGKWDIIDVTPLKKY